MCSWNWQTHSFCLVAHLKFGEVYWARSNWLYRHIKLLLKQLGAPLERNMYMEVPCQQMCNGHEHVCLGVDVISVVGFCFFGMEMTMTDALGWNRWWLQNETWWLKKCLAGVCWSGKQFNQVTEVVLHVRNTVVITSLSLIKYSTWELTHATELTSYLVMCSLTRQFSGWETTMETRGYCASFPIA